MVAYNDKEASAKNSNVAGDGRRHGTRDGTRRRSTPQRPCDDVVRDKTRCSAIAESAAGCVSFGQPWKTGTERQLRTL